MSYAADFRTMADAMPQLVWTARPDGSVEYFNERFIDYTGYRPDDIPSPHGLERIIHPDDVAGVVERWNAALASGRPFEMEFRLRRGFDGSYRWFLTRALPVRNSLSEIERWIGTATDIDEQKRAHESLSLVLDATQLFASASDEKALCDDFSRLMVQRFADWCVIALYGNDGKLRLCGLQHRDAEKTQRWRKLADQYPLPLDETLKDTIERGVAKLVPSISDAMLFRTARSPQHLSALQELGLRSAIVAPLVHGGRALGAILLYSAESRRVFDHADVEVVCTLAERAATAISNAHRLSTEQRARRRLQFIGKATEAIYESLDLTASFGELMRLIVANFGDFAVTLRLEHETALRVIGAAHRDPEKDDIARALVGVRTMHTQAERSFAKSLRAHKPTIVRDLDPDAVAESMWPYLAQEIIELEPRASITVPLHSRGITYGAIIVYYACKDRVPTESDEEILAEIARHASVAMENADVFERERHIAQTLQDSLLPPSMPKFENMRFDAVYLPGASAALVGGDWYDAWRLDDGAVVINVGDVTGRGMDAAVIMGKVRHLMAIAPSYERDPARILDTVESVLRRRYADVVVTAFLGIIDTKQRTIRYANAGHPYPLLRRSTGTDELRADGLPLGLRSEAPPSESVTVDLSDAKLLVLYTDGLTEANHDVLEGQRRLQEVVDSDAVLHTHNPAQFIEESCLGGAVDDDVAILTLSFEPSKRWTFDAENARAAQDARGEFVHYLRRHVVNGSSISAAELVFGELVGNVVRHAPGPIDIDLDWSREHPVLHVIDRGKPFQPDGKLPPDILSESGRGLYIVRQLTSSLKVEHVPGYGNHVTAELPLRRSLE